VAHNNEFKNQQAERMMALRFGQVPPSLGEIDNAPSDPDVAAVREAGLVAALR
jgi:hypothetical protein